MVQPADHLRFAALPDNLYSRPTLIWSLDNAGSPKQRVEASYLANSLAWNADYVLTVARDDRTAGLSGWVTLNNQSGTAFRRARLQLVAGALNRVLDERSRRESFQAAAMKAGSADEAFAQEAFSEYHLYTLDRRTSIQNNQTKQLALLESDGFPLAKAFVVDGQQFYYHNQQHPGAPIKDVTDLQRRVAAVEPGRPSPMTVIRDKTRTTLTIKIGEQPGDTTVAAAPAPKEEMLGLKVEPVTPEAAQRYKLTAKSGVLVTAVTSGSSGEAAGIRPGDVILEVNRKPVPSIEAFKSTIAAAKPGEPLPVYLQRGGGRNEYVVLTVPEPKR